MHAEEKHARQVRHAVDEKRINMSGPPSRADENTESNSSKKRKSKFLVRESPVGLARKYDRQQVTIDHCRLISRAKKCKEEEENWKKWAPPDSLYKDPSGANFTADPPSVCLRA